MTITINTGNAAFDNGNKNREIARILRELAHAFEHGSVSGKLYDVNGNAVGRVRGE